MKGLRLEQESVKKLKTSEEVKATEEVPKENIKPATSDKEKELWVELKILFEPDVKDYLWTHTQNLMHAQVEWKLYDTCGVQCVNKRPRYLHADREGLPSEEGSGDCDDQLQASRIDETDCHHEEEICLIEKLLYDNSSPRPPEEFISENSDAAIESFSPSPIPVEDSDSLMEEINLSFTSDDSMPSGIENDDYDSE
nr:hypothetical protein [Tanacetum cinerariifolium]